MEQIKSNLKAVVGSSKSGIPLNKLEEEYKRVTNSTLNFRKYSATLEDFVRSINDVVQLRQFNNICYVILVTTETDPQCLKNLFDLIQNTRNRKAAKSATHVPQNVLARANQFNNLRISLNNELCAPSRSAALEPRSAYNQFTQQKSQCNGFSRSTGNSAYKRSDNALLPRPRSVIRPQPVFNNSYNARNDKRSPNELQCNNNSDNRSRNYPRNLEQNCNDNTSSTTNNLSANKPNIEVNQSNQQSNIENHQSEQRSNVENHQSEQRSNVENHQSEQRSNVENQRSDQKSQIENNQSEQKSSIHSNQLEPKSPIENIESGRESNINSNQLQSRSFIENNQSELNYNTKNNQSEARSPIQNKQQTSNIQSNQWEQRPLTEDDEIQHESDIKNHQSEQGAQIENDQSKQESNIVNSQADPNFIIDNKRPEQSAETIYSCQLKRKDDSKTDQLITPAVFGMENEPLLWPMNFENNVQILHRQVKILGIQSGYAIASLLETMPKSQYVDARPIGDAIGYPGDVLIWQPPIIDPDRPPCKIDTATAFPVVLIGRLVNNNRNCGGFGTVSDSSVQGLARVRVLGQRVIITVEAIHLFWPGRRAQSGLLAACQVRQTSLCRLAAVPGFINLWEESSSPSGSGSSMLEGTFFAPVSVSCSETAGGPENGGGEQEFVFERCERRGDFLNCSLLLHGSVARVPLLGPGRQHVFVQLWLARLMECKRALRPCFEAMLAVTGSARDILSSTSGGSGMCLMASESSALLPISDISKCENRMLIGCPYLFSGGTFQNGSRDVGTFGRLELHLERVVFNSVTREFQYFDTNLSKANVVIPERPCGPDSGQGTDKVPPLHGIYILNERFVNSRLSHVSMLRFQAALLLLPDFSRIRCGTQQSGKPDTQAHK